VSVTDRESIGNRNFVSPGTRGAETKLYHDWNVRNIAEQELQQKGVSTAATSLARRRVRLAW